MYQQRENWQLKSLQAGTDGTGKEERQTGWNRDYNIGVGSKEAGGIWRNEEKDQKYAAYKAMH